MITPTLVTALAGALLAGAAGIWAWCAGRRARALAERLRVAEAEAALMAAALGAAPAAYVVARAGRLACSPGVAERLGLDREPPDWDAVAARLQGRQAALLPEAVTRLAATGAGFELRAGVADCERTLALIGRRVAGADGPADVVWLVDADAEATAEARLESQYRALTAEVDRLRAVLDALPLPVWVRARDLSLVYCNSAYVRALDLESAAVALLEGHEIASGAIDDDGQALAERARRSGGAQSESHHIVIGGARRLFEFTETPLDRAGYLAGWAQDFTQLEEVQAELGRHIEAHGDVLELLRSGIAIFDQGQRLIFFNSAYALAWDLDPDWLRTEPEYGEVLEALRERRRLPEVTDFQAFKRAASARFRSVLEPEEEYLYLPDERTLRMVTAPHPLGGLVMLYEDVTDRLGLERSYHTLIEVQRETINELEEGIAVYGTDGRLKLFNPAYRRIWDIDLPLDGEPHVTEVVERMRAADPAGDDWAAAKQEIVHAVTARSVLTDRRHTAAGRVVSYAFSPLADGSVMATNYDVTDSDKVERALIERSEALEAADRLKAEFLANVSYELRTPLNTIIGFSEILAHGLAGPLDERQREYVDGVLQASKTLLALIDDILDLSMMETGYVRPDFREIDLGELMASAHDILRERMAAKSLSVEVAIAADLPLVEADARCFRHIAFNLLSNAMKFTSTGGSVRVTARPRGPDEIELEVEHSGPDMDPADRERVEAARRDGLPTRTAQSGLGMTLVKRFVDMHGGSVELEAKPDRRTVVRCRLPVRRPAALATE